MHHPSEIDFEIIWKSLHQLSNKEEDELLHSWLNDHPTHAAFFEHARKYYLDGSAFTAMPDFMHQAWLQFEKTNMQTRLPLRPLLLAITGVAAAILIMVSIFFLPKHPELGIPIAEADVAFLPGTNKAVLITEDGSVINLATPEMRNIKMGNVSILNSGKELAYKTDHVRAVKSGYHQIVVPRGGEYLLVLADGSRIWLNAESSLRYPAVFSGTERRVELIGEAYFEITENMDMPFVVASGGQMVKVLGTKFNVSAYADDDLILTTLKEGSVEVYSLENTDMRIVLIPNDQSRLNKDLGSISVVQVSTDAYMAWKEGRFVFRDLTLDEIMKRLARWYDVDIEFSNAQKKDIRFTGNLQRYSNFEAFLVVLEKTHEVRFSVNNQTVYVN